MFFLHVRCTFVARKWENRSFLYVLSTLQSHTTSSITKIKCRCQHFDACLWMILHKSYTLSYNTLRYPHVAQGMRWTEPQRFTSKNAQVLHFCETRVVILLWDCGIINHTVTMKLRLCKKKEMCHISYFLILYLFLAMLNTDISEVRLCVCELPLLY